MNAVSASKSRAANLREGMVLTGIFHSFPIFATAAVLLKLTGRSGMLDPPGGAAGFVLLASVTQAITIGLLAPKFPRFFKNIHEPLFFDASLSFREKILRWRMLPATSLQLVTMVMTLSVVAVVLASVR